jgi:hypothetical protein
LQNNLSKKCGSEEAIKERDGVKERKRERKKERNRKRQEERKIRKKSSYDQQSVDCNTDIVFILLFLIFKFKISQYSSNKTTGIISMFYSIIQLQTCCIVSCFFFFISSLNNCKKCIA